MYITRLKLLNWRNFRDVNITLRDRVFLVGPNASGKSNFLDVLRFLRDIAKSEGGGLQKAVRQRGGVSKIRCLAARRDPHIVIELDISEVFDDAPEWTYHLSFAQESRGRRLTIITQEKVWHNGNLVLDRPDENDKKDTARLTQTHLEQIITNELFRPIVRFFEAFTYLHLVPQLLRYADNFQGTWIEDDPFGQGFLERVANTTERIRTARLKRIEEALKIAVPQLEQLQFDKDKITGRPHLHALYSHWRPRAGWQREDQFSDGTLRFLGLLWALLESDSVLLLEEPELSLHTAIVSQLSPLIYRMQRQRKRQVFISTHSADLLSDKGIGGREVLLLRPDVEGTEITIASKLEEARILLESGMSVGEVILPMSTPEHVEQLGMF